jgi:hypothetical protein
MSTIYESKEEMHRLEAVLYPNHLTGGEGTYLAKNTKEKTINVEAICAAMKNRGGYEGSTDEAIKTVNHFFKEMMYQLCDGFSVNTGWFTATVHIGGLFHSVKEVFDRKKHKVSFKFHTLKPMRELTSLVEIVISGHVDEPAFMAEFRDMEDPDSPENMYAPGNVGEILGQRIKIEGPEAEVGLWIVPVTAPQDRQKVERVISNTAGRIEFIVPDTYYAEHRLEIRTRFSGSPTPLHTLRVITSPFTISRI